MWRVAVHDLPRAVEDLPRLFDLALELLELLPLGFEPGLGRFLPAFDLLPFLEGPFRSSSMPRSIASPRRSRMRLESSLRRLSGLASGVGSAVDALSMASASPCSWASDSEEQKWICWSSSGRPKGFLGFVRPKRAWKEYWGGALIWHRPGRSNRTQ
jgi:hypothetical protein